MLLDQFLSGSKKGRRCSAAVALGQMKADGNTALFDGVRQWFHTPPGNSYSVADVRRLLIQQGYEVSLQQLGAHRAAFTNQAGRYCSCTEEKVDAIIEAVVREQAASA